MLFQIRMPMLSVHSSTRWARQIVPTSSAQISAARTPLSSKRPEHRTQDKDSAKRNDAGHDHGHHHIEIALAVGQPADLKQQQDRAIVWQRIERAGANRGHPMH